MCWNIHPLASWNARKMLDRYSLKELPKCHPVSSEFHAMQAKVLSHKNLDQVITLILLMRNIQCAHLTVHCWAWIETMKVLTQILLRFDFLKENWYVVVKTGTLESMNRKLYFKKIWLCTRWIYLKNIGEWYYEWCSCMRTLLLTKFVNPSYSFYLTVINNSTLPSYSYSFSTSNHIFFLTYTFLFSPTSLSCVFRN